MGAPARARAPGRAGLQPRPTREPGAPWRAKKVYNEYAMSVQQKLHAAGACRRRPQPEHAAEDDPERAAEQYNFILVVGEKEVDTRGVGVRTRDSNEVAQAIKPLDDLIAERLDGPQGGMTPRH